MSQIEKLLSDLDAKLADWPEGKAAYWTESIPRTQADWRQLAAELRAVQSCPYADPADEDAVPWSEVIEVIADAEAEAHP